MKTRTFLVTLDFSSDVDTFEEIAEVMNNLLEGISLQANNQLPPKKGDTYTEKITIEYPLFSLKVDKEL